MRRVFVLMAVLLGCIPIRTVRWRAREGIGEVATPVAYMGVSYQQRAAAETVMRKLCQGPFEVEEEGSRDSGDTASTAHVSRSWGGGIGAIGSTVQQKEYFWQFRCVDEEN